MKNKFVEYLKKYCEFQLLKWKGLGAFTKHLVRHRCGYEWEVNYACFSQAIGSGCPDCAIKNNSISEEKCL